jgi:hypothetical protein
VDLSSFLTKPDRQNRKFELQSKIGYPIYYCLSRYLPIIINNPEDIDDYKICYSIFKDHSEPEGPVFSSPAILLTKIGGPEKT